MGHTHCKRRCSASADSLDFFRENQKMIFDRLRNLEESDSKKQKEINSLQERDLKKQQEIKLLQERDLIKQREIESLKLLVEELKNDLKSSNQQIATNTAS